MNQRRLERACRKRGPFVFQARVDWGHVWRTVRRNGRGRVEPLFSTVPSYNLAAEVWRNQRRAWAPMPIPRGSLP